MKATIDSAGRIVIPKPVRDALGFRPGQLLELGVREGRVEIEVAPTPMKLRRRDGVVTAVPEQRLPPLTAEEVRATLERVRR